MPLASFHTIKARVSERYQRLRRWFLLTTALCFGLTGIGKVLGSLGGSKLLFTTDPIIGIQFKHLLLWTGVVELAVAVISLRKRFAGVALLLTAWLSGSFLVYRAGLWWMNWHRPCGCLGNLTDALHIPPETADNIMKVVLAYLLIGSYGLLLWDWKLLRQTRNFAGSNPPEQATA